MTPSLADSASRAVKLSGVERSPKERPNVVIGVVAERRSVRRRDRALRAPAGARGHAHGDARARRPRRRELGNAQRGRGTRSRIETATVDVLAAPETARAVDLVLASPLPEAVGRSLAEHQVVERVVSEVLASADLEARDHRPRSRASAPRSSSSRCSRAPRSRGC